VLFRSQAWLAHEWLVAALFEVLHRVGGLGLVVWACAVVCLLALAALRRVLDAEEIRSPLARLSVLLFAGVCMRNVVLARQVLTITIRKETSDSAELRFVGPPELSGRIAGELRSLSH
jgi:hypothetical protein